MSHPDRPDPPDELPAAELALLSAYRSERAMPRSAKARMIERLEAEPAAASSIAPRVVAASVAIAAALVLAWGVTSLRSSAVDRDEPSTTSPQAAMQPGRDDAGATARSREPEPETPARRDPSSKQLGPAPLEANPSVDPPELPDALGGELPEAEVEPSAEPEPVTPGPKRRRPEPEEPKPSPEPAPEPASQLQQERALLAKAWTALADGHPGKALGHTRDHADRFGSPILGIERKAIATIAGCQTRRPGWPERAESFLSTHGKTPLAPRVREACQNPEKKPDEP